ncbi:hypothetical protein [Bacillus cereus group sp. N3]|uniref:hypothetical protein n=1 Tax=Bacillus cereus group sp. N3 TaxID=2794582 RepID=UPI0018F6154D|nr:hypothetical protein [Bacillus cereus group sp. N3]MBJ8128917.1 hypothetical protein [Bacillus cereus group sp. N3]
MYLLNIFYDNPNGHGNFQWASIAAIVAFIAAIINLFNVYRTNKLSFKGNIVAKSRIEWIQEVRKKSVDFMSACHNLFEFIRSHDENLRNKEEFLKLKHEVEKHGALLILYFGPDSNKNNDLIVCIVSTILEQTRNRDGWYNENELPILADKVDVLRDFLRIYFKAEWKRANGEIKDSQVQGYLEKNDMYIKITRIFEGQLQDHGEWTECFYNELEERYTPREP